MLPSFHRYPGSPVRRTHRSRASFSSSMPPFAQQFVPGSTSPFAPPELFKSDPDRASAVADEQQQRERDGANNEIEYIPTFWHRNSLLHSPVSRNHTMNPFARHTSHENLALAFSQYTYPPQSPVAALMWQQSEPTQSPPSTISPAQIPLPRSVSPPTPNGQSDSPSASTDS
jgi:hypothetical protein